MATQALGSYCERVEYSLTYVSFPSFNAPYGHENTVQLQSTQQKPHNSPFTGHCLKQSLQNFNRRVFDEVRKYRLIEIEQIYARVRFLGKYTFLASRVQQVFYRGRWLGWRGSDGSEQWQMLKILSKTVALHESSGQQNAFAGKQNKTFYSCMCLLNQIAPSHAAFQNFLK